MEIALLIAVVVAIYLWKNKLSYERSDVNNEVINELVDEEELPYYKTKYLLTKAENNFYQSLKVALKDEALYVCPKIRVADVLRVGKTDNRRGYFNKIKAKHIDFLICKDDRFFNPVLAIELDDSSHNEKNRVERDEFMYKAFKTAKLPLYRVKARNAYQPNLLKKDIYTILGIENATAKVKKKEEKVAEVKTTTKKHVFKEDDYKDIKIGALVRKSFPELIENNLISKSELSKLLMYDYSKTTFDLNFPILKKVDHNKSIKENRFEGNYTRYYANPIKIHGEDYLMTSEWFERSKSFYTFWLKRQRDV